MPYHLNWKYIQTFYFFMQQGNFKNDTLITKIFIIYYQKPLSHLFDEFHAMLLPQFEWPHRCSFLVPLIPEFALLLFVAVRGLN